MFTGLVETTGIVKELQSRGNYLVLTISSNLPGDEISIGDSISCDGTCLTVVRQDRDSFTVEASQETIACAITGRYRVGTQVNLERALRMGDRLGGHFVTGHVDCTGVIAYLRSAGESLELAVDYDRKYDALVIEKGSVAVNGVSLTVNACSSGRFTVNLIPHTVAETNLTKAREGKVVNLEFDLIGKYVLKTHSAASTGGLTMDILNKSGW